MQIIFQMFSLNRITILTTYYHSFLFKILSTKVKEHTSS